MQNYIRNTGTNDKFTDYSNQLPHLESAKIVVHADSKSHYVLHAANLRAIKIFSNQTLTHMLCAAPDYGSIAMLRQGRQTAATKTLYHPFDFRLRPSQS
jgi:hypothetical protein